VEGLFFGDGLEVKINRCSGEGLVIQGEGIHIKIFVRGIEGGKVSEGRLISKGVYFGHMIEATEDGPSEFEGFMGMIFLGLILPNEFPRGWEVGERTEHNIFGLEQGGRKGMFIVEDEVKVFKVFGLLLVGGVEKAVLG
jgi:hypothetical protein